MISIQYCVHKDEYIDCEILEVKNGLYHIQFENDNKLWVEKSELRFPAFGDKVI